MKLTFMLLAITCLVGATGAVWSDQYVRGYSRSNGTYVQPHYRSDPDGNSYNNYSSKGNYNPYTGKEGTRTPGYDQNESGSSFGNDDNNSSSGNW